ncbi:hypothetical protein GCK32_002029 [Trichostrongylus colubriformis]|uniref:Uncharacterized protein n=1 Tax=Trichostrongylus colubriformis TaxID=6319 RepID=A0AAN8EXH0_TRICO
MSDCCCEVSIDVPTWVPAAIAFGISVAVAIAVIIAYVLREMERHRTFYGREDKLSSRDQPAEMKKKEEMDAYVLGRCSEEVLVIKSPQKSPGAQGTTRSGVKLIDLLNREPVILGTRTKRAEALMQQIKDRLEAMTERSFIVYGHLAESKWLVKGLENLEDNVEETNLQLRLNIDALGLKIMAYKMQAVSADKAAMMSMRARTSEALRPEPTQATPGSRWIARRGLTPEQDGTPNLETPLPQSRKKSAELIEQDRRNKELLRDAAKNLRQAMQSPTVDGGYSFSSPAGPHSVDKISGTRKSLIATSKGAMKRSFKTRGKEAKERHYMPKGLAEATPTKKSSDLKTTSPDSPGTIMKGLMIPAPSDQPEHSERKQGDGKPESKPRSLVKKTQMSAEPDYKTRKPKSLNL